MADTLVLNCLVTHDRPFNVQAVADLLATKGVKKPQAQRSLDALAQAKKIRMKLTHVSCFKRLLEQDVPAAQLQLKHSDLQEFGKTKLYMPLHDGQVLDREELDQKRASNAQMSGTVAEIQSTVKQYQRELASLRNAVTITQITTDCRKLDQEVDQLQQRIMPLRAGKSTISAADYASVHQELHKRTDAWQQRKKIFNNVWGAMSEGCDMKEKDVFEDAGVDSDEAMNVSLRDFIQLTAKRRRA